jgi:hypothetical protein
VPAHLLGELSVYDDRWGRANGLAVTGMGKFRLAAKGISIKAE